MPRRYAVRAEIYRPNVILGVRDSDWKWILLMTLAALAVPVIFEWFVWLIPVSVFTTALALGGGIAFFNWTRLGRRPRWLEFQIQALLEKPISRRRFPQERNAGLSYIIHK